MEGDQNTVRDASKTHIKAGPSVTMAEASWMQEVSQPLLSPTSQATSDGNEIGTQHLSASVTASSSYARNGVRV